MRELSQYELFSQQVSKIYESRLKRRFTNKPPWQLRKTRDIARAFNNPDIVQDIGVLFCCTKQSVMEYHTLLIEYLEKNYGLSLEVSESLILASAQKDIAALIASNQIDGVRYFNTDLEIMGPRLSDKSYDNLLNDINRHDPHMNIRIGHSATKQDVLWFINKYWKSEIEPVSNPYKKNGRSKRDRPAMLRDATIYALRKNGWKYADIQNFIHDEYKKFMDESTLRKIYERHVPKYHLFDKAAEQMKPLLKDSIYNNDPDFELSLKLVKDGKNSHFEVTKM